MLLTINCRFKGRQGRVWAQDLGGKGVGDVHTSWSMCDAEVGVGGDGSYYGCNATCPEHGYIGSLGKR